MVDAIDSDNFPNMARSAGKSVREALQKSPSPARETQVHAAYEPDSLGIEPRPGQLNILQTLMGTFEKQVFKQRHSGGKLTWHKVVVIKATPNDDGASQQGTRETLSNDDSASNQQTWETPPSGKKSPDGEKGRWLLAISAEGDVEDKIGDSFSLDQRFDVKTGDIFIEYVIVQARA